GAEVLLPGARVEAEHRAGVDGRREPGDRRAADALCRRVGRDQLGVALLELSQLGEQGVVSLVRDLGLVRYVVQEVVAVDLATQLVYTLHDVGRGAHALNPKA